MVGSSNIQGSILGQKSRSVYTERITSPYCSFANHLIVMSVMRCKHFSHSPLEQVTTESLVSEHLKAHNRMRLCRRWQYSERSGSRECSISNTMCNKGTNVSLRLKFPMCTCIKSHLTFLFKMFPPGNQ